MLLDYSGTRPLPSLPRRKAADRSRIGYPPFALSKISQPLCLL